MFETKTPILDSTSCLRQNQCPKLHHPVLRTLQSNSRTKLFHLTRQLQQTMREKHQQLLATNAEAKHRNVSAKTASDGRRHGNVVTAIVWSLSLSRWNVARERESCTHCSRRTASKFYSNVQQHGSLEKWTSCTRTWSECKLGLFPSREFTHKCMLCTTLLSTNAQTCCVGNN